MYRVPKIIVLPTPSHLKGDGFYGQFLTTSCRSMLEILKTQRKVAEDFGFEKNLVNIPYNRDVIVMTFGPECTESDKKFVFQHELAHWIRWKKRCHSRFRMMLCNYFFLVLFWEEFIINWYLLRGSSRFYNSMALAVKSTNERFKRNLILKGLSFIFKCP